ncbi:phage late control D family protein [Sphingomonas psychrotolerans]|uniref:Phage late control D family protein n=1 Tax=Sphingomonas psychrotolerans TaxID=1327635 RepID=A0ABU3N122_9SPHN|nr:contractile injection system protein, VgrG/Pvc8 family [Sphingomonas psychrotolerans]MDT8758254.1 phage late control D family protein [Sphingomonas psychrotolerans]
MADKVNPRALELTLRERRGGEADELSLTLHNHDGRLIAPDEGKIIVLAIGWESGNDVTIGLIEKGRFKVDEVEESGPPDIITIRARSADLTGNYAKRRTKSWKGTTLGAVINDIASRNGLTARVHPNLAANPIAAIEQHGKSDMAFVRDLGRRYDAVATWKDRKLVFMPIGSATTASGKTIPRLTLARTEGWSWRFSRAQRDDHDGAEAEWHDSDAGRRRKVVVGGSNRRKLKRIYASEAEATQAAKATASRGKRSWTFEYELAFADPAIQPNQPVTLSGWSARVDGKKWLVESVETSMRGSDGLSQRISLESA